MRVVIHAIVLILLAAIAIQTWLVAGLGVPCRVVGGSMAETLLGRHRKVTCGDCGYRFPCGIDGLPTPVRAVCPHCGYAASGVESLPDCEGDGVLIDRAAFSCRLPRRWEVAAFRHHSAADQVVVKRIVGLPGESIQIRNGDVFANGQIQRKSLAQQRALAVLVYDAGFRPTREPMPARWQPERPDSHWSENAGGFSHAASGDRPADWLVYHHWQRLAAGGTVESPITDICGYNASRPRREEDVHAVTDSMLTFRLEPTSGRGTVLIHMADGSRAFETRLRFDGPRIECSAVDTQSPLGERPTIRRAAPASSAIRLVEATLVDQQFLLAVDGRLMMVWPYERAKASEPPSCHLAIGAEGDSVAIRELRVYRDTYYTQPVAPPGRRPVDQPLLLGEGEYFVLGDNSSASDDSRTWPEPGTVDAKSLIGKPLVAVPSFSVSAWGSRCFHVPNLLQMRYIR